MVFGAVFSRDISHRCKIKNKNNGYKGIISKGKKYGFFIRQ